MVTNDTYYTYVIDMTSSQVELLCNIVDEQSHL